MFSSPRGADGIVGRGQQMLACAGRYAHWVAPLTTVSHSRFSSLGFDMEVERLLGHWLSPQLSTVSGCSLSRLCPAWESEGGIPGKVAV